MTKQILIRNTHENMTPIIRSILVSLDSETETIITFEKDEYHFYKDGSLHQMSYASGSLSAENDTIFHINQKRNVTIDGNGSDFVFCDRVQPFTLKNTKNITLKNFAIDFSFMRYAYADIISISDDGFTKFHTGFFPHVQCTIDKMRHRGNLFLFRLCPLEDKETVFGSGACHIQ